MLLEIGLVMGDVIVDEDRDIDRGEMHLEIGGDIADDGIDVAVRIWAFVNRAKGVKTAVLLEDIAAAVNINRVEDGGDVMLVGL